jgi:hypothetical protein
MSQGNVVWIFIFLQLHSFTTIHDTWSDPPPNNITTTIQLLSPTTTMQFLLPACNNTLEGGWVLLNA